MIARVAGRAHPEVHYLRIAALGFSAAAVTALFADFALETTPLTPIINASSIADRMDCLRAVDVGVLHRAGFKTRTCGQYGNRACHRN